MQTFSSVNFFNLSHNDFHLLFSVQVLMSIQYFCVIVFMCPFKQLYSHPVRISPFQCMTLFIDKLMHVCTNKSLKYIFCFAIMFAL